MPFANGAGTNPLTPPVKLLYVVSVSGGVTQVLSSLKNLSENVPAGNCGTNPAEEEVAAPGIVGTKGGVYVSVPPLSYVKVPVPLLPT